MKILVSAVDFPPATGGVAGCSLELARALAALPGVEVRILAPASPDGAVDFAVDRESLPFTHRVRLPRTPELAVAPLAWATRRVIRDWHPDLVLDTLWWPCAVATALARASLFSGRPRQGILVHGVEILESGRTARKRLRARFAFAKRALFRRADFVLPVSRYTRGLVEAHCGVAADRCVPFGNGVNPERFRPAPSRFPRSEFAPAGVPILFTLTRLDDYKGIDVTLRALALLAGRGREFRYLVGGAGSDRPRLERIVAELGLQSRVRFLGKVPDRDVPDLYNLCDVHVLLSREDLEFPNVEGFGLVYLEAAACGKPSLGPNLGGPVDAVVDGQTGRLVCPTSPEEAAAALEQLLYAPDLLRRLGEAGLRRAREEFSWRRVAERFLEGVAPRCAD